MSLEGVQAARDKIAFDLFNIIDAVFQNDAVSINRKTGTNTLVDSRLRYDLFVDEIQDADVVIQALFNHYVVYLEWTRPPFYGKQPPIDVLVDWAADNGIPTDAETLYAISYAIWRDGHTGRPIFATIDVEADKRFNIDWGDNLLAALTDNLDKFFNS